MFATPSCFAISGDWQVCSDIAAWKCARLLLNPQSWISGSESRPEYRQQSTHLLCPRCGFQTEGLQCFCPVRIQSRILDSRVERRKVQTCRERRGLRLRERRACVARCVPPGNNVAGALLTRGCRAARPVRMRASIRAAISGDAEHALL